MDLPTSPETEVVDPDETETLASLRALHDPWSQELIGDHLHGMCYHAVELDAEWKVSSAATGLSLGIRAGWLRWLTVEGAVVPTPLELAEQEKRRAEQAEQLVAMYRRHFGDLGGRREQEQ